MKNSKIKKIGDFSLLPPAPDLCQECAVKHKPEEPHDANSFYYQMSFYLDHRRYPKWEDAIAHCPRAVRRAWTKLLKQRGLW